MGAPIKREFLLLYLIIKMSSIFRPQLFPDAFPVKGRQNSVKILHRSQSSLPLISFSSGRGLYFRFTLKVLPKFLSNWHTVFPGIVSPESILFWIHPYVLWPLATVHRGAHWSRRSKSVQKTYRISANSFRGNYSFLNSTLCTVTFSNSTYRCGNYSREETIQGRKLFKGGNYSRKYGNCKFHH